MIKRLFQKIFRLQQCPRKKCVSVLRSKIKNCYTKLNICRCYYIGMYISLQHKDFI